MHRYMKRGENVIHNHPLSSTAWVGVPPLRPSSHPTCHGEQASIAEERERQRKREKERERERKREREGLNCQGIFVAYNNGRKDSLRISIFLFRFWIIFSFFPFF